MTNSSRNQPPQPMVCPACGRYYEMKRKIDLRRPQSDIRGEGGELYWSYDHTHPPIIDDYCRVEISEGDPGWFHIKDRDHEGNPEIEPE